MRIKSRNRMCKVTLLLLIVLNGNVSVFCDHRWGNDPDFIGVHTLRHQQHSENGIHGHQPTVNIRHHNHHHHHTTTTKSPITTPTTTTTTMTPKESWARQIMSTTVAPIEDHHLRHSNKFYQTWELYRDPKYTSRRRIGAQAQHHTTQAPRIPRDKMQGTPHRRSSNLINHNKINNNHFTGDKLANIVNVTTVMKSRYFDRDALYSPARSIGLFWSKHKDRLHSRPTKKWYDDDQNYDDDNNMWSNSFIDNNRNTMDQTSVALKSIERNGHRKSKHFYSDDDNDDSVNQFQNDKNNRHQMDSGTKQYFDDEVVDDIYTKSYIPGTLTKHKLDTLGTHEAVKESRHAYLTNQQQKKELANAHATRIYSEATCRWPKPKIIAVQNDPAKTYLPHCTILHRCGDDTGCCNTDTRTCIASHSQNVDLYFYVSTLGNKQGTIEKQTFINHTECQCVDKFSQSQYPAPELMRKATVISCTCPKLFEKVLQEDGTCRCDCSSGNNGCDWKKKGKEHFSMDDRRCIMDGRCKIPTCEYGKYDKRHGRCPRKEDKLAVGFSYRQN